MQYHMLKLNVHVVGKNISAKVDIEHTWSITYIVTSLRLSQRSVFQLVVSLRLIV